MAGYDDIIKGLPPEPTPGFATPLPAVKTPESPYAGIIREMEGADHARASASAFAAQQGNPDEAARAAQIAPAVGAPPSVVASDLPTFEAQYKTRQNSEVLRANPVLSSWVLANPEAVRIAHDDFDRLGFIEKTVKAAKLGFDEGILQDQLARTGWDKLAGGDSAKATDAEKKLKEQLARPDGVDTGFYGAVKKISSFIGGMVPQVVQASKVAAGGMAVGAAVPGVGLALGAGAGAMAGMVQQGFETGAGQLYNQLKAERDSNGNPIDDDVARGAALSGGLVLGLLNMMPVAAVFTPLRGAMEAIIPALSKKIIEKPTAARAVGEFAKGIAKGAATGATFGVMSQATMLAAENVGKMVDSGEWATLMNSPDKREEALDRIVESAVDMAVTFGVLHAPGGSLGLMAELARANKAKAQRMFIDSLADGSAASKTRDRSTDAFQNFMAAQTDGTPVENLYIPAEKIREVYEQAGVDPMNPAQDHLFPFVKNMGEQLSQAAEVGGDVLIKTADYATHIAGSDIDKSLRDHIRVGADGMSMDEAKTFFQTYKEELGKRGAEAKANMSKGEESADKIRTDVQKQLEEAGTAPRTAGGMAQQMAAFFRTIGARIGMDPGELFGKLEIKREKLGSGPPEDAFEQKNKRGNLEMSPYYRNEDLGDVMAQIEGVIEDGGKYPTEKLRSSQVRATQDWLRDPGEAFTDDPVVPGMGDKPVVVKTADGLYHIMDGHHRFSAAADGDKPVEAYVVDMGYTPEPNKTYMQPVFHGSPHVFDKFELRAIGSGEGAQAYGWGLYFASNKKVAEWYRKQLVQRKNSIDMNVHGDAYNKLNEKQQGWVESYLEHRNNGASHKEATAFVLEEGSSTGEEAKVYPELTLTPMESKQLAEFLNAPNLTKSEGGKGRLYHVEIPDHENMLNLDLPLHEQPEPVQKALKAAGLLKEPNERTKMWNEYQSLMGEGGSVEESIHTNIKLIAEALNPDFKGPNDQYDFSLNQVRESLESDPKLLAQARRAVELWDKIGRQAEPQILAGGQFINLDPKGQGFSLLMSQFLMAMPSLMSTDKPVVISRQMLGRVRKGAQEAFDRHQDGADDVLREINRIVASKEEVVYKPKDDDIDYDQASTGRELYQKLAEEPQDNIDTTGMDLSAIADEDGNINFDEHSPEELASRYLNHIGIPGLSYLEGASRSKGEGAYNYVLFDDSLAKIVHYEQPHIEGQDEARGYVTFGPGNKIKIALLERANLSTFLHESGHVYLEILKNVSKMPEGAAIADDVASIARYLGIKSLDDLTAKEHEKFARSFEAYLMEGIAPSRELAGAFSRFRRWLTTIYQTITNLNVQLTDEVRGVFDRMLASSDEIAAARREQRLEALFTDAKTAGMTDEEFGAYKNAVKRVTERADDKLLERVMADVRRQRTKAWKAEAANVRSEVAEKVDARPDIIALTALRDDMRMNRAELLATFGDDILTKLPSGRPGRPIFGADGESLVDLAERFGFGSPDDMVNSLIKLEARQRRIRTADGEKRGIRQYMIEQEVDSRMAKEHGDLLADDAIRDEAISKLHSTGQAEVLATELRALGRQGGTPPMPVSVARNWARGVIESKRIREGTRAWFYSREEAKQGRAVERALLSGDRTEALRAKQQQLLNHVLYMEARDASEYVETATRRLERYASAKVIRSIDPDYLEQIHNLLERFDFREASGAEVERRYSLRDWVTRQEGEGAEVRIRDTLLNDAFRKHYTEMTLDEFRGLDEAVQNIAHIGKLKGTLLDRAERRDFREVVQEAAEQVQGMKQLGVPDIRNPKQGGRGLDRLDAKWTAFKSGLRSADSSLLKMEQVFDWLDRGNPDGVFNRIVFRRIADGQHAESDMRKDLTAKMKALTANLTKEQRADFLNRYQVDELIDSRTGKPSQLLKSEIVSIALNMGNASNLDKMLRGEGWSESSVRAVLDRHMTAGDWKFVQGVWDSLDALWPQIAALEERLAGFAPTKVEKLKVATPHGEFDGGYYPVVYDPLRSYDVELNRQKSADTLFENNYQRATTSHGFTIERKAAYAKPLYLSLDVLSRHLGQVAHDLAFREAVIDADRFLQNPDIRKAVEGVMGREVYQQFRPWLQAIANERNYDERGLAWWDRLIHNARTNTSLVGMGFRATTMVSQIAGLSDSAEVLGARWVASGVASFYGSPQKMIGARDFVFNRSGEMKHRMDNLERDIHDGLRELIGKTGPVAAVRRFAYYGIGVMDMAVSMPTWLGAYNKALHENMSEADAVYAADKSVRASQGAGALKDQAALQRGSEFQKTITMFYSYFNHFYNRQRAIGHDLQAAHDLPMVIARSFWLMALPPLFAAYTGNQGPKEDEGVAAWAARTIGTNLFGGIPIARDIANAVGGGYDYKASPIIRAVESAGKAGKDLLGLISEDHEVSDKWVRHALETSGYVFGLPLGQAGATSQFLWDVMHDVQDPKDLSDWIHGIMTGRISQEPVK